MTAFYAAVLYLLGGGNPSFGIATLLLMVATTTFVAATPLLLTRHPPLSWPATAGLLLVIAIPLVQIIPLPPAIWHALPGQALRIDVLALAGLDQTWQPISLALVDTTYVVVMTGGFVALVMALTVMDGRSFQRVSVLLLALIALSIVIGVVQVTTRGDFPRFFEKCDAGSLIGFFSNKNHMALAISASLPLAWRALSFGRTRDNASLFQILFFAYWGVAIVAIVATASRAGLAIGVMVSLAIALLMTRKAKAWHRAAIGLVVTALAAAVMNSSVFETVMERFGNVGNDYRWRFVAQSLPLLREYWVTGAGGGAFYDLFITTERLEWVKPTIVNHVHNDYVELVIEYGIAGVCALGLIGAAVVQSAWTARRMPGYDAQQRWAGLIIVVAIALHSIVDYPLRRPAMLAIFAFSLAMLWRAPGERGESLK
ncbi:O-antigen ligase family protein [uncultured Sphingomonas sp.]|uniref:O-antigen ligase family protein n=1 Tax=uncultured Sphingomonas sp. TaxID=158754 RepID=UPI0035CC5C25